VSNLIGNLQAKITQLADGSISASQRTIYTADFNALTSQVANFISQANYNGTNLLSAASAAKTFLADTNATVLTISSQSTVDAAFNTFAATANIVATASDAAAGLATLSTFQQAVATSLGANASETRSLTLQSNFVNSIVDATTGPGPAGSPAAWHPVAIDRQPAADSAFGPVPLTVPKLPHIERPRILAGPFFVQKCAISSALLRSFLDDAAKRCILL
jgi:flagellin-like hook-associated protein FlgL